MKNQQDSRRAFLSALAMMAIIGMGLTGCSKVNKENYDKLKLGMGYDEVVQILGEPDQCEALIAAKHCTWGEPPKKHITVELIADKVLLFQGQGF